MSEAPEYLWPGRKGPFADRPIRAPMPYYGGKHYHRKWIIAHMPYHEVYVEPFVGAGSVLLAKKRAKLETINDIDGAIAAMWRALRDRIYELLPLLAATEFGREVVEEARRAATEGGDLRVAWGAIVSGCVGLDGYASGAAFKTSYRSVATGSTGSRLSLRLLDFLEIHDRLRDVQIERLDALECIRKYGVPEAVVYCDPPYLGETRVQTGKYRVECASAWEHRKIIDALLGLESAVLLSGYDSRLYRESLESRGWVRVQKPVVAYSSRAVTGRTECLWLNPEAVKRVESERGGQLSLFS